MATTGYCVKCKEKDREMEDEERVEREKGADMIKGKCSVCGTNMTTFVKKGE